MPISINPFTGLIDEIGVPRLEMARAPTSADYQFALGTEWVDTDAGDLWFLATKSGVTGTWKQIVGGSTGITQVDTDSGSASPVAGVIDIVGGEGIDTSGATNVITITGEDATTSNKGIASFATADFGVTSGAVSLADTVVKSVTTDSGALTPSSHSFSILGGEGMDATHAGTVITVAGEDATTTNKGIASFDTYDFSISSGAVSLRPGSQLVFVGKWGNDSADGLTYSSAKLTVQGAIDSITDNTTSKRYVVMIYPGTYTEDIVLEDWVSLKGIGQPNYVIIAGTNSAPLLTFDTDSSSTFVENILFQLAPTTDAQSIATMTNGTHKFEGCKFQVTSSTQDIGANVINQSGGTLFIDNCNLSYTMSATATTTAKEHIILNLSGTHTTKVSGFIRTAISIADTDDNFTFVKEVGTTTKLELRRIDSDVQTTNAAHTGTVKFLDTTAAGVEHTREITNNAVDFIQTTGTPNNFCYPYVIDSTSNDAHIHSSGNIIHASGYGTSVFATIATGDTVLSNFDDVEIDTTHTGAGTFTYAFSHEDGEFDTQTLNLTTAFNFDKDLGTLATGEQEYAWECSVDAASTTGGDMHVIDVSLTEASGGAEVVAMGTHTGVDVIHQHVGTAATADKCWSVDSAAWTDRTTAFGSAGTDVQIFAADDDYIYIGDIAMFDVVNFVATTAASVDLKFTFEYWNSSWTSFSPLDTTSGFSQNGSIAIPDLSADWTTTQVNGEGDGPWYYVRLKRTKNHVVTAPTEDTIKITSTSGGEYSWDKDGVITCKELKPSTDLAVQYGGTGASTLTNHGLLVGSGTSAVTALTVGTNGQLCIGSTGADPVFGTPGSSDSTITWTLGAGTLTAQARAGGEGQTGVLELATGAETTTGTSTALAVHPDGLDTRLGAQTDHGVILGGGGAGFNLGVTAVGSTGTILTGVSGADPAWTTATYPATTAQGDLLLSASANTITALTKDANATRYLSNTGANNNAAWAQVDVSNGVTGTLPVTNGGTGVATLTTAYGVLCAGTTATGAVQPLGALGGAGTVLTSNGAAALPSFQAAATPFTWNIVTDASDTMVADNGYICNRGTLVTLTLPASVSLGDSFKVVNIGAGFVKIAQNASDDLRYGISTTTTGAGGDITCTALGDAVEIVGQAANTYLVTSSIGNWDIT